MYNAICGVGERRDGGNRPDLRIAPTLGYHLLFGSFWEVTLLTESEVQRSFRKLFNGGSIDIERLEKGEQLLDELRPESPLRHRLGIELEELRQLSEAKSAG